MKGIPVIKLLICCFCFCSMAAFANGGGDANEQKSNNQAAVSASTNTETIKWLTMDEALRLYKIAPKKIFVDLYTDWCTLCKKMDASTFQHPEIVNYINQHFYPVKMDAEMRNTIVFNNKAYEFLPNEGSNGLHSLVLYLTRGRPSFPSIVFLDEKMDNPQAVRGFLNPVRMEKISVYFAENFYKQYEWGIFNKTYKSKISESSGQSAITSTTKEIRKSNSKQGQSTTSTLSDDKKDRGKSQKKTPPVRKRRLRTTVQ